MSKHHDQIAYNKKFGKRLSKDPIPIPDHLKNVKYTEYKDLLWYRVENALIKNEDQNFRYKMEIFKRGKMSEAV